jgi:hypothetical protein
MKQRRNVCETILAALEGKLAVDVSSSDLRFVSATVIADLDT